MPNVMDHLIFLMLQMCLTAKTLSLCVFLFRNEQFNWTDCGPLHLVFNTPGRFGRSGFGAPALRYSNKRMTHFLKDHRMMFLSVNEDK